MAKSYRIRTEIGVDKQLNVQLDQDFEYLEILSLKILQEQIYSRPCSDYGVIVGRLTVNGGYGLPNAKVSVFIPITNQDKLNPIISELYPYEKVTDQNVDGYRYNLLPYTKSYSAHVPTGTFFSRDDVLTNPVLVEIYDKYYKYCASTNAAGDFMIFGVPLGTYKVHCDVDLSDIGEFSLSPQDLLRMGVASAAQVSGTNFKSSTNLNELPQIINLNSDVDVTPLWGQPEICNLGITRVDFDLTKLSKIQIQPTAILMGSLISTSDDHYQKSNCKPVLKQGNLCSLIPGPGSIQAIRQNIFIDDDGRPGLEEFELEQGGQVIDENGAFMLDVPMNLEYVITNEFGEQVISPEPDKGIPTKGKYRFKIKWAQGNSLSEPIKRGYFLIPNIREYWSNPDIDPFTFSNPDPNVNPAFALAEKSYSFTTNWDDYPNPKLAIQCKDYFFEMTYNKVYTVSQFMDSYNRGSLLNRKLGIKDILDSTCEGDVNKFPVNDGQFQFDIVYILFTILLFIVYIILNAFLVYYHLLGLVIKIVGAFIGWVLNNVAFVLRKFCGFVNDYLINPLKNFYIGPPINWGPFNWMSPITWCNNAAEKLEVWAKTFEDMYKFFENVQIPNLTYPDCQLCDCKTGEKIDEPINDDPQVGLATLVAQQLNSKSFLAPITAPEIFDNTRKLIPIYPGATIPFIATPSGVTTTQNTPPDMLYRNYNTQVSQVLAGLNFLPDEEGSSQQRVPSSVSFGVNYNGLYTNGGGNLATPRVLFTTSLPLSERINLFNLKSKYFNESPGSYAGLGVNRIKVTFDTDLNQSNQKYHLDNTLTLLVNNDYLKSLIPGQLICFQDPSLSFDPNLTGVTELNQFGGTSITGVSINTGLANNTPSKISIDYANPDGSGNLTTIYDIVQEEGDMYQKFATDIEYFMVITAMTYNEFSGMCNPSAKETTLNKRFLGNISKMEVLRTPYGEWDTKTSFSYAPNVTIGPDFTGFTVNPLQGIKDGKNQGVVFLVRGVDPHSSRTKNKYDLSYLFGYTEDEWGSHPECIVEGTDNLKFFLNQPIKGGLYSVRNDLTDSFQIDDYSGIRLYYDSFRFQPSYSGYASFSSYTTNLTTYYSSLDGSFAATGDTVFKPDTIAPPITDAVYGDTTFGANNLVCYPNITSNFFTKEFYKSLLVSDCVTATGVAYKPDFNDMKINLPYVLEDSKYVYTSSTAGIITAVSSVFYTSELDRTLSYNINVAAFGCYGGQIILRAVIKNGSAPAQFYGKIVSASGCYGTVLDISDLKLVSFNSRVLLGLAKIYPYVTGGLYRGFNISFFSPSNFSDEKSGEVYDIINPSYYTAFPTFTTFDMAINDGDGVGSIIFAYSVPTNTTLPTATPTGYPVLQRGASPSSFSVGVYTTYPTLTFGGPNSPYIQVDSFTINKIKVATDGLLGLIFCGYKKANPSFQNKLYLKIYDGAGNQRAYFTPTGTTANYITLDTVSDFSISVSPYNSRFLVCWIDNLGNIKFQTYNYVFQNFTLQSILKNNAAPISVPFDRVQFGTPSTVTAKYHEVSRHFTITWQTSNGKTFYLQYFDDTYTNPSIGGTPVQVSTTIPNYTGSTTQTGATFYDMAVNPYNDTFAVAFQNKSSGGTIYKAFNNSVYIPANRNRGYYQYEFLEGGGVMMMKSEATTSCVANLTNPNAPYWSFKGYYYAPTYSKNIYLTVRLPEPGTVITGDTVNFSGPGGGETETLNPPTIVPFFPTPKLVMRADRLPTSTYEDKSFNNSYPLHTNQFFTAFLLSDDGLAFVLGGKPTTPPNVPSGGDDDSTNPTTSLLSTTTCGGLVPLACYSSTDGSISTKPSTDPCYYNRVGTSATDKILKNGCYVTVTRIWETLINGRDFELLGEWKARIDINFAACRNVFGHYFRNNWINGVLYAFSIQNDRLFSPPGTGPFFNSTPISPQNPWVTQTAYVTEPNSPYSNYCFRTVHLDSRTNEFFYRSSPFYQDDADTGEGAFVGRNNLNTEGEPNGPKGSNSYFLMFPTTLVDLGPRSNYLQEIVMSDEFDGYVTGDLTPSTYNDMQPPLNLFILSRLVSLNLEALLKGVFYYFNRGFYIDGDYAQIAATNTQFGVKPFNENTYNNVTGQTQQPVFFNARVNGYPLLGIFYESDLSLRDAISPRRVIVNGDVPVSFCSFNKIKTFSQVVPQYQWNISTDNNQTPYIFGSINSSWYTKRIYETINLSESFAQNKIQDLDRISTDSRYFRTINQDSSKNFKSYIYSVATDYYFPQNPRVNITANADTWSKNNILLEDRPATLINFGAPFYFYFGLKKGKTAIDLFRKKWVSTNKIKK